MSKWLALSVAVASLTLTACSQSKEFTSKEGRFTVLRPIRAEPAIYANTLNDPVAGSLTNNHVNFHSNDLTWSVSYWDYPEGFVRDNNSAKILADLVSQMKANFKTDSRLKDGTFLIDQETSNGTFPGREFVYAYGSDSKQGYLWIMKTEFHLVGGRMYALFGDGLKEHVSEIDQFIDSFALAGK